MTTFQRGHSHDTLAFKVFSLSYVYCTDCYREKLKEQVCEFNLQTVPYKLFYSLLLKLVPGAFSKCLCFMKHLNYVFETHF